MDKGFKLAGEGYAFNGLVPSKENGAKFTDIIKGVLKINTINGGKLDYNEIRNKLIPEVVQFENMFELKEHKVEA